MVNGEWKVANRAVKSIRPVNYQARFTIYHLLFTQVPFKEPVADGEECLRILVAGIMAQTGHGDDLDLVERMRPARDAVQ